MDEFMELVGEDNVEEALKGPEVKDAALSLAQQAVDYAQSISPVGGPHDPHPGQYRDSIHVEQDGEQVSVVFGDENANLIEYGSINNPEYAVRARTEEYLNGLR